MEYLLLLLLGLVFLILGGELLVRGAESIALKLKITPFVIGMTIVAFGTSAPELLVSLKATLDGSPDISIGNVVGSNIANIALVLGVTSLIYPIKVNKSAIKIDWPMLMLASFLFYICAYNGRDLSMFEGIFFVSILIVFITWMIRKSRRTFNIESQEKSEDLLSQKSKKPNLLVSILYIIIGCITLIFGSEWLVDGAKNIARTFNVSESVISLSMVAIGTSLPELATSIMAAIKKQTDIALGNILGSNLFNILSILGITAIVKDIEVNEMILHSDIFWMLGLSAVIFPMMLYERDISRSEGAILVIAYSAYIYFLIQ